MKNVLVLAVAVFFLVGLACPTSYAKGGHGGGHSGHGGGRGGGFHGGHGRAGHGSGFYGSHRGYYGGGTYRTGGYRGGYRHYSAHVSYGWYGAGFFGVVSPWYFYGAPHSDPDAQPLAPAYPEFSPGESDEQGSTETPGEWVEVPGQSVDGTWVPPHKVWLPEGP